MHLNIEKDVYFQALPGTRGFCAGSSMAAQANAIS